MRQRTAGWWASAGLAIGVLVAVVVLVLSGRAGARDTAEPPRGKLLPEASGSLAEVVIHYVPAVEPLVRDTYLDFLRAMDGDVRVLFVIAREGAADARSRLSALLADADPSGGLASRSSIVESAGPITTWAKDRALVSSPRAPGKPTLLIAPAEPPRDWLARHNDWLTVESIARQSGGRYEAEVAPLDFDAGDFTVASDRVLVDANLLEKNRHRGIGDVIELRKRLAAWLGAPVAVLGQRPGDTPRHHLSMYMTPLHDNVVLVGDPRLAAAIVGSPFRPGEPSVETAEPLTADFGDATLRRFDRAADDLKRQGYRVVRIANVPFDDKTYMSYTNGVYETRGSRRIAYVPRYGVEAMDASARAVYEGLGWEVRPVRVRSVYSRHGTIGCLVNVLERR